MELSGKVALITGGARNLGKAYAEALLQKKAKVLITDLLEEVGQETEKEFQEKYGKESVLFAVGDVTKQESMEAVFALAVSHFGRLDIAINNAGVSYVPDAVAYAVNQFGVIRCTEIAQKMMRKDQGGQGGVIVNIGSVAGLFSLPTSPAAYFATKHAVVGYTSSLGSEVALTPDQGVRMAVMCPGFAKTELVGPFVDGYEAGVPEVIATVKACGGWTPIEKLVETMLKILEQDLPGGAVVLALADGAFLLDHGPGCTKSVRKPI